MNKERKFGRKTVVVVVLAVLCCAALALAQAEWELTPGEGGPSYSPAFKVKPAAEGEASGELEVVGAGGAAPVSRVEPYDGLLDNGPARFAP